MSTRKKNAPVVVPPRLHPGPNKKSIPSITVSVSITPRCLSVASAALYLGGVTEWFVEEELCRSGKVPFRLLGNQRVIETADLDRWLDSQKKQTGKLMAPLLREVA